GAGLFQDNAQILFAIVFICFAVFWCLVVTRNEMRRPAAGLFQHLIPIEREEMFVLPRPPGKGIDTIKPKHVIDAKEMKNRSDCTHASPPPREVVCTHFLPAINRYAPVLAPFLRKGIILKI